MSCKNLASKYIDKAKNIFDEIKILEEKDSLRYEEVKEVIEEARRYFEDAKFYLDRKEWGTSLTDIAYCEGLLDSLRLLDLVAFSWKMEDRKKKTVVLAKGTFDLLHYGHIYYLTKAKETGGVSAELKVVVARDKTVERLKGVKPIIHENQRMAIVSSLRVVDDVFLGYESIDMKRVIDTIKPSIIAVGYDQEDLEMKLLKYVEESKYAIKIIRVGKFQAEKLSSSEIKRRIIENYDK